MRDNSPHGSRTVKHIHRQDTVCLRLTFDTFYEKWLHFSPLSHSALHAFLSSFAEKIYKDRWNEHWHLCVWGLLCKVLTGDWQFKWVYSTVQYSKLEIIHRQQYRISPINRNFVLQVQCFMHIQNLNLEHDENIAWLSKPVANREHIFTCNTWCIPPNVWWWSNGT